MFTNTNAKCSICGRELTRRGSSFVCPHCSEQKNEATARTVAAVMLCICAAIVFSGIGLGGIGMGIIAILVIRLCCRAAAALDAEAEKEKEPPVPKTAYEFSILFRKASDPAKPLSIFASEAAAQLQSLRQKQNALKMMLGEDHPFVASSREAEAYILANCKKILFRLSCCDLSDPVMRESHAEYIRERLTENAVVLHDFERLNIEVSQMDDETPVAFPRLDILADTLRDMHTPAPEPDYTAQFAAIQQQNMQHMQQMQQI